MSYTFGRDIVQEFTEANNISLICRAHQVVEDGYQFFQRRQVSIATCTSICMNYHIHVVYTATVFLREYIIFIFFYLSLDNAKELVNFSKY